MPSMSEDPEGFSKMVESRLMDLHNRTQAAAHALQNEIEAATARHKDTQQAIERYRAEALGRDQTVATGGLRQQLLGLFFVLIGLILQTVGQIWQSI
jgi:hypothetical protein